MQEEIIKMYRDAGYSPKEVIMSLSELLGFYILANKENTVRIETDDMVIVTAVMESKNE